MWNQIYESFTHLHGYCCRDQAASNVGKILFTRMANSFVLPPQNWARTTNDNSQFILFAEELSTPKSHLVQKKGKAIFSMKWIVSSESYIHRVKTISFKWTSHVSWHCGPLHWIKKGSRMSFKGRGKFLLQRSSHLCKILLEVLIISFYLISRARSWKTKKVLIKVL